MRQLNSRLPVASLTLIVISAVLALGFTSWTPGAGGACGHVAVFDPSGEDGCTVNWTCSGSVPPLLCKRAYQEFNQGACKYRPVRTHTFDAPRCYWEDINGDYIYGCIFPLNLSPTFSWEPHPDNPINCEPPSSPPNPSIFLTGPCPVLNDFILELGSARFYCDSL
jgi:hypothetical protein